METFRNKTEKEIESMKRVIIPVKIDFETIKKIFRYGKRIIKCKTGKGNR